MEPNDDGAQAPLQRYSSLVDFYRADQRRLESRERDVGLWWREDAAGPLHRAAWVSDTGELYLVRLGPSEQGGGSVEVLARVADADQLESVLSGWRERCGQERSLGWLRDRAAGLRRRARRRPVRVVASVAGSAGLVGSAAVLSVAGPRTR
jgi:hypothetical protein